ncbi:MAG: hypothetical protein EHM57_04360 [Actinobacteria bacterium]|nr:MAG: hypothetical protein EHM57_04360 [Actinomycetota bacterium]
MFTRARWFLFGVAATVGATTYLFTRARRMRERMTPVAAARAAAVTLADGMAFAGRWLSASGGRHRAAG